jgi:hypothetical protein
MLIDKRSAPDIGDVVTIKLASGEEIVGRLQEKIGDTITLAKPLQVIIQPISASQIGLGFRPLLGSVSEAAIVQFPLSTLAIRPIKTGDDVTRNYIQVTTGLVTAEHMPSILSP